MTSSIWSAGRYEAVAERISTIAGQIVDSVGTRTALDGAEVVDLACGTGSASLAAAAAGARVTGVDITPELLTIASDKASAAGTSVTWLPGDAADTGLPDAAFDVALSNMGIIFVEPARQVAEITRLLKSQGVLGFSSWVRATPNPFFDPIVAVLGAPPATGFTPDQWGDPQTANARLAADFEDVAIEGGQHTWALGSMAEALRFLSMESPMHVEVFRRADEAERARLVTAFEAALQPHLDAAGTVRFEVPYVVITARRR